MTYTPPDPVARQRVDAWRDVELGDTADPAEIRDIFDRAIGVDDSLDRESLIPNGMAEWFVVAQTSSRRSTSLAHRCSGSRSASRRTIALVGFGPEFSAAGTAACHIHPNALIIAVAYRR
jgi:hypothetical protein